MIINLIHKQGNMVQKEIANRLLKDQSRVTRMIDKLVKLGFLLRVMDDNDRRAFNIELTKDGEFLIEKISNKIIEIEKKIVDGFEGYEIEMLRKLLERVINNLSIQ